MKKTFTFLLLVITTLTFAQGYKIYEGTTDVTGKTIDVKIWPDDDFPLEFKMFNGYSSDKRYLVDRIVVGAKDSCYRFIMKIGDYCLLTDDDSLYTTPLSFDFPAKSYIPNPKDITDYEMSFHLLTCEKCIDHTVKYKLYTEGTPSENAEVTINYTCATGIKDYDLGTISPAYPNPANGLITIDYTLKNTPKNAKIVFYDMLGKTVKETAIANQQQGSAKINVADLHTGFYFYNFIVDGKTSNARKLIISGN